MVENMDSNKPLRFALLIELEGTIDIEGYKTQIRNLISKECHNQEIELVTLAGGSWKRSPYQNNEEQRNKIYNLINKDNFDGLILVFTITSFSTSDENSELFDIFDNLPVVCIGIPDRQIPSIAVDNSHGIRELVDHLVIHHNFKKIGFISGPYGNAESIERLKAYKKALEWHDIETDPDLIEGGDFLSESGEVAITRMVNRNRVPRAIIAANDQMAIGAILALKKFGYKVPEQVSVVGFDDFYKANIVIPPLTTVAQPFKQIAHECINKLKALVNGEEYLDDRIVLNPKLVVRSSCGCNPHYHENIKYDFSSDNYGKDLHLMFYNDAPIYDEIDKSNLIPIISGFSDFLRTGQIDEAYILKELRSFFFSTESEFFQFEEWNNFFSKLNSYIISNVKSKKGIIEQSYLFQKIRLLLAEIWCRTKSSKILNTQLRMENLHLMSMRLDNCNNLSEFLEQYRKELLHFGIINCILYLSESEIIDKKYELKENYSSTLFCVSEIRNREEFVEKYIEKSFSSIVVDGISVFESNKTFIAEPLYHLNYMIGVLVIEDTINESIFYESFRDIISTSLFNIYSRDKNRELSNKLEQTLKELEVSNNKFKELSMYDYLTEIYNRRGFKSSFNKIHKLAEREGVESILIYADLNGLKKINDTYGHSEGDRAIKETANALNKVFRGSDIISRIGGDEFLIYAYNSNLDKFDEMVNRINDILDKKSKSLKLEYKIQLSCGVINIDPSSNNIDDLIKKADKNLYERKKH